MVHKVKVSLRGLKTQIVTSGYGMRELKSKVTNSQGSYVGSFTTSGVGLQEHQRRLEAIKKDTVRTIKGKHEK
tara:strand:+ start:71 stop:289 length:219 start_codon:yes stop_codon:yes gene_type:complete